MTEDSKVAWPMVRLEDVCRFVAGLTFKKSDASTEKRQASDIATLRAGNIQNGKIVMDELVYLPNAIIKPAQYLMVNDILMATSSGSLDVLGKSAIVKESANISFGAFLRVIRPNPNRVDPTFLFHLLSSDRILAEIRATGKGANINNLRSSSLSELQIPLPPLAEQRRIAEILESSTESIRKTKQHIRAIEELKSSVFDSQISNCAKVAKPLGELCTQKPDYGIGAASEPFTNEKGRYLRITDITEQGGLHSDAVSPAGSVDELDPEKMVRPGDLLIARSGATVGKSYLHLAGNDASWFAGYLVRFRINQELINPRIVFDFCHTEKFKAWIANRQQVAAQPNINAQIYAKELHIPIPDPTSAQKYLELRSHISMELDCLQKKVSLLKELHQSLSTRAFAGQL